MSRIVSSLPGRIRVRDKGLRDQAKLNELKNVLSQLSGVTSLHDNRRTGSLLLYFDRKAIELSVMEEKIESIIEKILGKAQKPQRLLSKKNVNRYNKIIMLGSLGTSLIALKLARRRPRIRWHKLTGYVFVANLGVHLYIYRKSLLRLFR